MLGVIGDPYNPVFRSLGVRVVGTPGVVRYVGLLALIASAIGIGVYVLRQGFTWSWPLQKLLLRIPVVGPALETLLISEDLLGFSTDSRGGNGCPKGSPA